MQRSAFGGRVTFEVVPHKTVRETIVSKGFIEAVPEWMSFTGVTMTLFSNLCLIMGRVKSIDFTDGETDESILALHEFWDTAHGNTNYRQVWESYLDLPTLDINNTIVDDVINSIAKADAVLMAPVEVRPGSPTDEQLEAMGEEGQAFLADGELTPSG